MDNFNALIERGKLDGLFMHNAVIFACAVIEAAGGPFHKLARMVPVALRAVPNSFLCPSIMISSAP